MQIFAPHLLIILCLLTATCCWAQIDSVYLLSTVEVKAGKIRVAPIGSPSQSWNTKTLDQSSATDLASLLNKEGGVYILSLIHI